MSTFVVQSGLIYSETTFCSLEQVASRLKALEVIDLGGRMTVKVTSDNFSTSNKMRLGRARYSNMLYFSIVLVQHTKAK